MGFREKGGNYILEIKRITLDKMTIVGQLSEHLAYALQNAINEPHVRVKGIPTTGYIEGQFFFYGYSEPVYYCYDDVNAKTMGKRNFRMEFNPAKITLEQSEWLKDKIIYVLDDIGITRLDIAFDCDFDLSVFEFEFKSALEGNKHWGRDGKTQTLYYGSRSSDFYYRIYNKKLEQEKELKRKLRAIEKRKENGLEVDESDPRYFIEPLAYDTEHWWRYEVEIKNADAVENIVNAGLPLFDDKRIIQHDIDALPVLDNLMLTGLLAKPDKWKELSKNTRTKYRKIMKSLGGYDVTHLFVEKLNEKKPELIGQINSWRGIKSSVV